MGAALLEFEKNSGKANGVVRRVRQWCVDIGLWFSHDNAQPASLSRDECTRMLEQAQEAQQDYNDAHGRLTIGDFNKLGRSGNTFYLTRGCSSKQLLHIQGQLSWHGMRSFAEMKEEDQGDSSDSTDESEESDDDNGIILVDAETRRRVKKQKKMKAMKERHAAPHIVSMTTALKRAMKENKMKGRDDGKILVHASPGPGFNSWMNEDFLEKRAGPDKSIEGLFFESSIAEAFSHLMGHQRFALVRAGWKD